MQELQHQVQATETVAKAAVDDILSNRTHNGPFISVARFHTHGESRQGELLLKNFGRTPAINLDQRGIHSSEGLKFHPFNPTELRVEEETRLIVMDLRPGKFEIVYDDIWNQRHSIWFEYDPQKYGIQRCAPPTP